MTGWARDAVFWHVYPLGFVGAPPQASPDPPVPRLRRLVGWLDYVVELGANGLLLGPVFASETHGYDTVDHYRVDPRLGTEEDLVSLVEECHRRGVKVVLDGVFNHVGRGFPRAADVAAHGDSSASASWFRRSADGRFATFEGHDQLVALNHDEPAVVDYVAEVLAHWTGRGVDGWRLDAAYAVPSPFWRQVTARTRAAHPDVWFLGEVIHGDYPTLVREGGLDSVTQYELWKAVWSSLNDGNLHELAWTLGRHDALLETFVPQTFLGNHDVTRLASRLEDARTVPHAVVVLMTVAGTPSIYAGDEQGFTGVKEDRAGGDDAVRPAFPETPSELSPLGAGTYRLHRELLALRRRHPWLSTARTRTHLIENRRLTYESTGGGERVLVVLSLEDAATTVEVPAAGWTAEAGDVDVQVGHVVVPPFGWAVLVASA